MTTPQIELRNITVSYPDGDRHITPVKNVNLQISAGHMVAITGESGSGKSSVLSVIAGLTVPTEGEVFIRGEVLPSDEENRTRWRRNTMGMVFQTPNLIPSLKVAEQLELVGKIQGKPIPQGRIQELLDNVGLAGLEQRPVQRLSGGQRQRVAIARALAAQPSILIADEPTAALDSQLSHQIISILRDVTHQYQIATVLVTHDRAEAARADRQYHLRDGTLIPGEEMVMSTSF
ncbi:ATP-binding cassette domain-containing protein [Corynebacterium poyangense]|uniref:ATP-binding cassette domain-containing protein n=1 Tax=Corynebacterium poyangense TaxID=2684405 RepID=A0A7H0SRP2_9CORY|nr:ABC transporter ATP-binding protein [Corynebacterium poyangense]MBZ8176650.1 ATP-binding cassette domain-containing protein [Corynebacterium poyangense]QNQ91217.1 ATP-binding cassette domain-containing protein [Corynebacterium poyangense]